MILFLLKYGTIAFLSGVATSFAESVFKYSLYDAVKDKLAKLFAKKS